LHLNQQHGRNRVLWIVLMAIVVALGLGTRLPALPFPRRFTGYLGDLLWALAVYVGYCLIFPGLATMKIATLAAVTSLLVEFSQLYHAPWIDSIRSTTFGHLLLGSGFDSIDLICYAAGIGVGVLIEKGLIQLAETRSTP
jgi:hypothetical protein